MLPIAFCSFGFTGVSISDNAPCKTEKAGHFSIYGHQVVGTFITADRFAFTGPNEYLQCRQFAHVPLTVTADEILTLNRIKSAADV